VIPEGLIKSLNRAFEKKTFHYKGPIVAYSSEGMEDGIEFDYTLKIVKQKQMISVGEWKDYLVVDIFIRNYKGMFSSLFNRLYNTDSFRFVLEYKLNEVMQRLGFSGYFWATINEIHLEENGL
jgi:hypothetical protein